MKVYDLVRNVLRNMNENTDSETVSMYYDEILMYLNMGYKEVLMTKVKPTKSVLVTSNNGKIDLSDVGEDIFEISRVIDVYGLDVRYSFNNKYIFCPDGEYMVEYVYMPKDLESDDDEPIINSNYHYILSDYATYRMFLRGSTQRQKRGDAFYNSYYSGLIRLSQPNNRYIINKFGSENYGRI